MTTVAYSDGFIAIDGRMINDNDGTVISEKYPKIMEENGVFFFFVGSVFSIPALMDAYFGREIKLPIETNALVVDEGELFYIGVDSQDKDNAFVYKEREDETTPFAHGSGRDHALTAMDLGKTPWTALMEVARRDVGTGGIITVFDINKKKVTEEYTPTIEYTREVKGGK